MKKISDGERGAALPMLLLACVLIVAATAALLSSAAANANNATDTLSEAKAYYTAESGIHAAVNALRNQSINYKTAVNTGGGRLETWIARDCSGYRSIGGSCDSKYDVTVTDPDDSQSRINFFSDTTTTGTVANSSGFSLDGVTFTTELDIPNSAAADRIKVTWVPTNPTSALLFSGNPSVTHSAGSVKLEKFGTNAVTLPKVYFRINVRLIAPETPTWVVKGNIEPGSPNTFKFQQDQTRIYGSDITLCADVNCTTLGQPNLNLSTLTTPTTEGVPTEHVFGLNLTPKEPQRLVIRSEGQYVPNGSKKTLEAIIQKTYFPAVPPATGLLMNGPNAVFDNGNGKPHYNGCDPANPDVCVPAIGTTSIQGLTNINNAGFKDPPNPNPPPAIIGEELPDWQKYPSEMDKYLNFWKQQAALGNGIKPNNTVLDTGQYGDYAAANGVTYCEGDCTIQGQGGGVLVVRGRLTTLGGVNFRGLVIVTGTEGMLRNGNGGPDDSIIGSVVIAPYILTPLPYGTWLTPKFKVNGGGNSNVTYSGLDFLFDGGISGATNFVSGVAEK